LIGVAVKKLLEAAETADISEVLDKIDVIIIIKIILVNDDAFLNRCNCVVTYYAFISIR
jgi:hypothetical protein